MNASKAHSQCDQKHSFLPLSPLIRQTSLVLLILGTTVGACSTQDDHETPREAEQDAGATTPSDAPEVDITPDLYPTCTLAEAEKSLGRSWARNDAKAVWSEAQYEQCKAVCASQSNQNQCAEDNCPNGLEYVACTYGWRYYCASQPDSGCSEEFRAFGCCVQASCAAADDAECISFACGDLLDRMDECAYDECAMTAREMCVR